MPPPPQSLRVRRPNAGTLADALLPRANATVATPDIPNSPNSPNSPVSLSSVSGGGHTSTISSAPSTATHVVPSTGPGTVVSPYIIAGLVIVGILLCILGIGAFMRWRKKRRVAFDGGPRPGTW